MKKFLIAAIAVLSLTACTDDKQPVVEYKKVIEVSNGKRFSDTCKKNSNYCNPVDMDTRTIGGDSKVLCDMIGKLYMVESEYKSGSVSILQEGLTCKFYIEEIITQKKPDDTIDKKVKKVAGDL